MRREFDYTTEGPQTNNRNLAYVGYNLHQFALGLRLFVGVHNLPDTSFSLHLHCPYLFYILPFSVYTLFLLAPLGVTLFYGVNNFYLFAPF